MIGTDLKRLLEKAIDDTLDNATTIDYFNSALRDLAPVARIATKATIPFTKTERSKTLPTNIVELKQVTVTFASGTSYKLEDLAYAYGMEIYENQSIDWTKDLPEDGTFEVRYYRTPIMLTTITETPEIPEMFHDALVHYGTREYFDADDEESVKANTKYLVLKAALDNHTSNRGTPSRPALPKGPPQPWLRR